MLEVGVVNVSIDSEQSLEDDFNDGCEVLREGYAQLTGEYFLVVELVLHPRHQEVYILACADFQWCLYVVTVCPQIFVLRSCTHGWT